MIKIAFFLAGIAFFLAGIGVVLAAEQEKPTPGGGAPQQANIWPEILGKPIPFGAALEIAIDPDGHPGPVKLTADGLVRAHCE